MASVTFSTPSSFVSAASGQAEEPNDAQNHRSERETPHETPPAPPARQRITGTEGESGDQGKTRNVSKTRTAKARTGRSGQEKGPGAELDALPGPRGCCGLTRVDGGNGGGPFPIRVLLSSSGSDRHRRGVTLLGRVLRSQEKKASAATFLHPEGQGSYRRVSSVEIAWREERHVLSLQVP